MDEDDAMSGADDVSSRFFRARHQASGSRWSDNDHYIRREASVIAIINVRQNYIV